MEKVEQKVVMVEEELRAAVERMYYYEMKAMNLSALKANYRLCLADLEFPNPYKKVNGERQETYPLFNTVWGFEKRLNKWAMQNLDTLFSLGFRVFETDELGLFIGVNETDRDLYESHLLPLYIAIYQP